MLFRSLKELKDFTVHGDKLIAPKPLKVAEEKSAFTEKPLSKKETELIIFGESSDKIKYTLANCCKPIPGDDVFGFITVDEGIKIHRTNCPNALQLMSKHGYRIVKARWTSRQGIAFLAGIMINGVDEVGVVNNITRVISNELKVNMRSISIDSNEG